MCSHGRRVGCARQVLTQLRKDGADALCLLNRGSGHGVGQTLTRHERRHRTAHERRPHGLLAQPGIRGRGQQQTPGNHLVTLCQSARKGLLSSGPLELIPRSLLMRLTVLVLLAAILAVAQTAFAQRGADPNQPPPVRAFANIKSPEVAANRNVTFRLAAPKASSVSVICECLTLEEAAKLKQQIEKLGQRPDTDPEMARLNRELAKVRSSQGERAMSRDASGMWSLTLPAVDSDLYEYPVTVARSQQPD